DPSPDLHRALLVRTPAAWRHVGISDMPMILVPVFEGPDVALALNRGHAVLVPLGREVEASSGIDLPRLRREGIERCLAERGLSQERASTLATVGRRSLMS